MFLYNFTMTVNYIALIIAWWFGLYVVTRNPRRLVSWLAGLTFWSMAGFFLNILLALAPPPPPHNLPEWSRIFALIWPTGTIEEGSSAWLQGWSITLAVMTWHHVTVIMRPGKSNRWRNFRVGAGYIIVAGVILIQLLQTHLLYTSTEGDPLYLNVLKPGPLYPLIALGIFLYIGMSIYNLLRSIPGAPSSIYRAQYQTLGVATLIAGLTVPISIISSLTAIPIPMVVQSMLYIATTVMMGYGVARYSALSEGRTARRDLAYNAVSMTFVVILYVLVTWASVSFYDAPSAAFIPMVLLAITTHMLIGAARQTMDKFFHHRSNQELRAYFRRLAGEIGENDVAELVSLALGAMSDTVRATYGLVLVFEGAQVRKLAGYKWAGTLPPLEVAALEADDVLSLDIDHFPAGLRNVTLLIPLYADAHQLGVILLGRPENGVAYSQADIESLLYPSDKLAETIRDAKKQEYYLAELSKTTETQREEPRRKGKKVAVKDVESTLRNLTDYAYLGDTKIAQMNLVRVRLPQDGNTHLDRGKVVYTIISKAIEKLRPAAGDVPPFPIPREWHAYLILHEAYIKDKPNRDIMSSLYISEGTFNRTRRAAIRSITRVLEEMEASLI